MAKLLPLQFHFRFRLKCRRVAWPPAAAPLPPACTLPNLSGIDGKSAFAEIRVAWAPEGFVLEWHVPEKKQPILGEVQRPDACDGLTLWLDARDTRDIHRATRRCLSFRILAHAGGVDATPAVAQLQIHRALEEAPTVDASTIVLTRKALGASGAPTPEKPGVPPRAYWLRAIFPAAALPGYDPSESAKLGFCYQLRDREHGEQLLAAGNEFPFAEDPSLWPTLELVEK